MISNLNYQGHDTVTSTSFDAEILVETPADTNPLFSMIAFDLLGWRDKETKEMLLRVTLQPGVQSTLTIQNGDENRILAPIQSNNQGLRNSFWTFIASTWDNSDWSLTINAEDSSRNAYGRWVFTKKKVR